MSVLSLLLGFSRTVPECAEKVAAEVSDADAAESLQRLKAIERSKPTLGQVGRYAAIGGAGTAVGAAIKDLAVKSPKDILGGPGKRLRTVAGNALAGAVVSGGAPLVRAHFDRQVEKGTLKKYLAQPAEKVAAPDEEKNRKLRRSAATTAIGSTLGLVGTSAAQNKLVNSFQSGGDRMANEGVSSKILDKIKSHNLPVQESFAGYQYMPNSHINVPVGVNARNANPAALAHELGHHNVQSHPILKYTQGERAIALRNPVTSARLGLLTGGLSGVSDNPWVRAAGIAAPALLSVPTLLSEGGASWNAMKHLRSAGADPALRSAARKNLGQAFGTYALQAGLGSVAAGLSHAGVRAVRGHMQEKEEHTKTAEAHLLEWLLKEADVSVGQWWENTGGPFLAKGGDHAKFKKMMDEAGFPDKVKERFTRVAKEKYPPTPRAYDFRGSYSSGGSYGTGHEGKSPKWPGSPPSSRTLATEMASNLKKNVVGLGALGGTALGLKMLTKQESDPDRAVGAWKAPVGNAISVGTALGGIMHRLAPSKDPRTALAVGIGFGLLGAGLGAGLGQAADNDANRYGTASGKRLKSEKGLRFVRDEAKKTWTNRAGGVAAASILPAAIAASLGGNVNSSGVLASIGAMGKGLSQERLSSTRYLSARDSFHKKQEQKTAGWVEYVKLAAGAPTRGGFLMASEVPAFRAPNVYRPVHKVTPQQIVEKMGSATTPAGRLSATRRVGLPKVSAPPGPAIADVAPTFGQRLPGANKTTIGKIAHI